MPIKPVVTSVLSTNVQAVLGTKRKIGPAPIKQVLAPTGFDWSVPFNVFRQGAVYYTDIDPSAYVIPSTEATYYLSPSGNDANDGLSAASPKRSLYTLVTALNATPPASVTFNLAPGVYTNGAGNTLSFNFNANLICEGGSAVVGRVLNLQWEAHTVTNVFRTTTAAVPYSSVAVADLADTELDYGIPPVYTVVSSIANVGANTRSSRVSSSILYVHTWNSRMPDSNVIVFDPTGSAWEQTASSTGRNFYCKNIVFAGGAEPVLISHSGTGTYFFDNCSFRYSRVDNGFRTSAGGNEIVTIMYGGDASYNFTDGYNYRGFTKAVEIGAKGVYNGRTNAGTSDNGSTAHVSVRTVRINGDYSYNGERNCHDIDTTQNWLVGCKAGFPFNATGSTDPVAIANFGVGSGLSTTWMEGCISSGGANSDVFAIGGAIMYMKRCLGMTAQHTDTGGQIIEGENAA